MVPWPHPNNPKVAKITLVHTLTGRQFLNTFYIYKASAPWAQADLAAVATAAKNWWTLAYAPCISTAVGLTQIQVRVMDPANPYAYDLPVTPAAPGTRIGVPEAGNVSVTLSERTGLAGRRHRGRMYLPGVNENDVLSGDIIGGTLATAIANAGVQLLIAFGQNLAVPVIFHRPGLVPSTFDNTVDVITSVIVDTILDSMRKRLPGRGR